MKEFNEKRKMIHFARDSHQLMLVSSHMILMHSYIFETPWSSKKVSSPFKKTKQRRMTHINFMKNHGVYKCYLTRHLMYYSENCNNWFQEIASWEKSYELFCDLSVLHQTMISLAWIVNAFSPNECHWSLSLHQIHSKCQNQCCL